MRLLVKFHSFHREITGIAELGLDMPSGSTLKEVVEKLKVLYPGLALHGEEILVSLNKRSVPSGTVLHEGDEISLIPPVTGG